MRERAAWFDHSTGRPDRADWQPLAEHLRAVADLGCSAIRATISSLKAVDLWLRNAARLV